MKRNSKYTKGKEIRSLFEEMYANRYYMEVVEVEEYYHHGWYVEYGLRDDVSRRDDAPMILEAMRHAYGVAIIYKSQYVTLLRNGVTKILRKWKYSDSGDYWQYLVPMPRKLYDQPPEHLHKYFRRYEEYIPWNNTTRSYYSIDIPEYYLKHKVKKRYSNQMLEINCDKQSRYDKLQNKVDKMNFERSTKCSEGRYYGGRYCGDEWNYWKTFNVNKEQRKWKYDCKQLINEYNYGRRI